MYSGEALVTFPQTQKSKGLPMTSATLTSILQWLYNIVLVY